MVPRRAAAVRRGRLTRTIQSMTGKEAMAQTVLTIRMFEQGTESRTPTSAPYTVPFIA